MSNTLSAARGAACANAADLETYIPTVANPLTARMHKGVNTTMDEGQTMIGEPFSFKAPHFTRDKDGAPSPVYPPLSADADKGDQDPLVCAPVAFNARQDPIFSEVALPIDTDGTTLAIAFDTTQITSAANRSNPQPGDPSHPLAAGAHAPAVAFQPRFARNGRGAPDTVASALTGEAGRTGKGDSAQCVAFSVSENSNGFAWESEVNPTLQAKAQCASANQFDGVLSGWAVRCLTPTECERLQAFPDGYTNIPWRGKNGAPDGPRYKALGNSMSVNVMRWLGMRIEKVEAIAK